MSEFSLILHPEIPKFTPSKLRNVGYMISRNDFITLPIKKAKISNRGILHFFILILNSDSAKTHPQHSNQRTPMLFISANEDHAILAEHSFFLIDHICVLSSDFPMREHHYHFDFPYFQATCHSHAPTRAIMLFLM
jgi:hypothetical protein